MKTTNLINSFFVLCLISTSFLAQAQNSLIESIDQLNSYADEMQPILSSEGDVLYLIRGHHRENVGGKSDLGDAYYSVKTDSGTWTSPAPLSDQINNKYFNGVLGIRGSELLVYGVYGSSSVPPGTKGISVVREIELGTSYGQLSELLIRYYKDGSELYGYSLSADGNILLLSMESYKSQGAEDIYVSFWDDQSRYWTEPKNLGPVVNTAFQELTPTLSPDNKTLFFSSNGHGGYGSRDIFYSTRNDDSWTNWTVPQNMAPEVNTEGAEMYFQYYPKHEIALYTSTMDSDGYGDIRVRDYSVQEMEDLLGEPVIIPAEPVAIVEEEVVPLVSEPEVGELLVKVRDANQNEIPFGAHLVLLSDSLESSAKVDGINEVMIPLEMPGQYNLTINAEGFMSTDTIITVNNLVSGSVLEIALNPIEVGTTIQLRNVLFRRGTTELLETSYRELDVVVEMMLANPGMKIKLAGHTDNQGNARLNQKLSQERVEAVIAYLSEKGIEKDRLSGKGYGGSRPIASNSNEQTRKLNRRVEFTIQRQ